MTPQHLIRSRSRRPSPAAARALPFALPLALAPAVSALLVLAGCSSTGGANSNKAATPSSGTKITLAGDGLTLGETQRTALQPDMLEEVIRQLLSEGRRQSAQLWVRRYPDVALEALRRDAGSSPHSAFVAVRFDQMSNPRAADWSSLVQFASENRPAMKAYQQRRGQVLASIRAGELAAADAVDIRSAVPANAPGDLLRIEALRLEGIASLLNDRHADAAAAFENAADLAGTDHPYLTAHLLLLASDGQRRAGKAGVAAEHWCRAVTAAGGLLDNDQPIRDPVLWERAAYLRPESVAWPDALVTPLTAALTEHCGRVWQSDERITLAAGDANAVATLVWANVGIWRLSRQEPQSALVALRRANALANSAAVRDELRLHQARALADMRQNTPAMSLLVSLMARPTPVGRSAMAAAGVMSIEQDQVQRGLALLKRAIDADQPEPWPGRAQAEADLALAYLIVGDEEKGLAMLHDAQQAFEGVAPGLLIKSLRNEQRYFEATGKMEGARSVGRRLASIEQND